MNRTELVERIQERSHLTKKEIMACLKIWEEEVGKALLQGDHLILMGFGTFSLWKQKERQGRNPMSSTPCLIAARNSVKFKPGKYLLMYLNGETAPVERDEYPQTKNKSKDDEG